MRGGGGRGPAVEFAASFAGPRGRGAVAEAVVELSMGGRMVTGRGASTESVTAGVQAYLYALNFLNASVPSGSGTTGG